MIRRLAKLSNIFFSASAPPGAVQLIVRGEVAALPLTGVIDFAAEKVRLQKDLARVNSDIARIDAKSKEVKLFPLPAAFAHATLNTLAFDGKGLVWFTGYNGVYGRADPKSGKVEAWKAPRGSGPYGMTGTPSGVGAVVAGDSGAAATSCAKGAAAAGVSSIAPVVDATNVEWMRRTELVRRARQHGRSATAIAFDLPLELCLARNAARSRSVRAAVVRRQHDELRRGLDRLDLEGFTAVYVLRSDGEIEGAIVQIEKGPVARAL